MKAVYAPIVLFVFARPKHTKETLDALVANELSSESDLIVYADGARDEGDVQPVKEVRRLIASIDHFRSITIIERDTNYGLARNIIEGVSEVMNRFGRAIVIEDDLIASPRFLVFMNGALDKYESKQKVWHICGWNYPIDLSGLGDTYFIRVMNCWGWATWADRWQHYERDTEKLLRSFNRGMIRDFNLEGVGPFWNHVLSNKVGRINSWAIYWYAIIFMNQGLCLQPCLTYVNNIGHDGTGTHGSESNGTYTYLTSVNQSKSIHFSDRIEEDRLVVARVVEFLRSDRPPLFRRLGWRLKVILGLGSDRL